MTFHPRLSDVLRWPDLSGLSDAHHHAERIGRLLTRHLIYRPHNTTELSPEGRMQRFAEFRNRVGVTMRRLGTPLTWLWVRENRRRQKGDVDGAGEHLHALLHVEPDSWVDDGLREALSRWNRSGPATGREYRVQPTHPGSFEYVVKQRDRFTTVSCFLPRDPDGRPRPLVPGEKIRLPRHEYGVKVLGDRWGVSADLRDVAEAAYKRRLDGGRRMGAAKDSDGSGRPPHFSRAYSCKLGKFYAGSTGRYG